MSCILVTGACGYIGRHVVTALLDAGHDVVAADIQDKGCDPRVELRLCDIFSGDADLYQQLGCPEVVVHMAWIDGFVHNSFQHLAYLPKHYRFLEQMLFGGAKQIAIMGTMHEVGYYEGEINEDTPTNPLSLYGVAKNALRQSCKVLQEQYPEAIFQWLRAYYICGDDAFNHSIFAKITVAQQAGKKTFPMNSGRNRYDFIGVAELARQIAAVVSQQEVRGIINCCTGEAVPLGKKVEEFIRDHGYSIQLEYGAFPDRAYDSPAVWGDPSKIRQIIAAAPEEVTNGC